MHDRSGEVMKCQLKAAKIIRTKKQKGNCKHKEVKKRQKNEKRLALRVNELKVKTTKSVNDVNLSARALVNCQKTGYETRYMIEEILW